MKNNYNVSFTSDIKIVPKSILKKVIKGPEIDHLSDYKKILKNQDFYTFDVRTCTAGGFVSLKEEPVGFHIYNTPTNFKNVKAFAKNILDMFDTQINNGLIFGGKKVSTENVASGETVKNRKVSIPMFQRFKKIFSEAVKNLSVFEEHQNTNGQTHYFHSQAENAHYLCAETQISDKNFQSVSTLEELKAFYKHIKIAKTDNLYINGKEITREMAPEIFA